MTLMNEPDRYRRQALDGAYDEVLRKEETNKPKGGKSLYGDDWYTEWHNKRPLLAERPHDALPALNRYEPDPA